ncbi:MAG: PrgI family protein [Oscillospiraceae bacterium]|jgi:hypothetical protein
MIYLIPKQLKEENKIFDRPRIWWKDVVTCTLLLGIFLMIRGFVHRWFVIPYWLTAALFSLYLIHPAAGNPRKRNWEAILLFLCKDYTVYTSINPVHKEEFHAD